MKINVFNEKNKKFQKNLDKHHLKKRNYIKQREILLDRILVMREKRYKKRVKLLIMIKIYKILQITDSIGRKK